MRNANVICVLRGHEPKNKKTSFPEQMIGLIEAKRREIHFGTHHNIVE